MKAIGMRWMLILILHFYCYASIISGVDTVANLKNIVFFPHSITSNHWCIDTNFHARAGYVYICHASLPQIDIFVASEILYVCTCPCDEISIGSPRPFYLSKVIFNSFDISKPLNLVDTSKFVKCDTIHIDKHFIYNIDSTHCYLPHFLYGSYSYPFLWAGDFLIIKNINNLYILVKFQPLYAVCIDYQPTPVYYTVLSGFLMTWYLQDNGSLDFSDITEIKLTRPLLGLNKDIKNKVDIEYFDLQGRSLISMKKRGLNVFIERNEKGVICKRILNSN